MRNRLALILVILFSLLQASSSSPQSVKAANVSASPPAGPIPASFFGLHVINDNWPISTFGVIRTSGVSWPTIEKSRGTFDWSNLDGQVSRAQQHSKPVYYATDGMPNWFGGVSDIQAWDDFVTAMVTRYKGKIEIYELWNEPDQDSKVSSMGMAGFVTMTQHMRDSIRKADPAALIASPATVGNVNWMDNYWGAGGVTDMDIVVLHGYPSQVPSQPETIGPKNAIPMVALMTKYGLTSKPMWDSEASWGDSTSGVTDLQQQAGFVARFYLLHWSNGFTRFYWYSWDDDGNGPGGVGWGSLFNPATKQALPGATAYQQVYNWMVGATMPSPCTMASDSTWTCSLTRPGGFQASAVWNSATSKSFTPPSQYKQWQDLAGGSHSVSGSVTIGYSPILLTSTSSPAPVPPTRLSLLVK